MKLEDIKIGMKVVPHSKYGDAYGLCWIWQAAKERNQKYLYVISIHEDSVSLSANNTDTVGNYYFPSDFEPYQEPTMTITQEQFDNLKEGDVVENEKYGKMTFQGKIGKIAFWIDNQNNFSTMVNFQSLNEIGYSLVTKPENYQGFTLGDYSDKTVVVAVSNNKEIHLNDSSTFVVGLLSKATKDGIYIKDFPTPFSYAQLINTTPFQLV